MCIFEVPSYNITGETPVLGRDYALLAAPHWRMMITCLPVLNTVPVVEPVARIGNHMPM